MEAADGEGMIAKVERRPERRRASLHRLPTPTATPHHHEHLSGRRGYAVTPCQKNANPSEKEAYAYQLGHRSGPFHRFVAGDKCSPPGHTSSTRCGSKGNECGERGRGEGGNGSWIDAPGYGPVRCGARAATCVILGIRRNGARGMGQVGVATATRHRHVCQQSVFTPSHYRRSHARRRAAAAVKCSAARCGMRFCARRVAIPVGLDGQAALF